MQLLEVQLYQNWILLVLFSTGAVTSDVIRFNSKIYADFGISLDGLVDGGTVLKQFTLKSRRQCCLECVSLSACKSVNHKKNGGNCELLGRSFNQAASALQPRSGWTYLSTNQEEIDAGPTCKMLSPCAVGSRCVEQDTASRFKCICDQFHSGTYCENERAYASCKAAYDAGLRTDGIYLLQGMGYHRCRLSALAGCSGGGWTLILRTDGKRTTFNYDASYWTTNNLYNHIYALKYNVETHGQEAKFPAFNQLSYTKVCIGLRNGGVSKFSETSATETSMLSLMQSGVYKQTYIGRSTWLGLLSGSYLQPYCNREGFNNRKSKYARIGILGNNENDCNSVDSVMGIGIGSASFDACTGNRASYGVTKKIQSRGFVLVQ
eukprot:gene9158-10131_t